MRKSNCCTLAAAVLLLCLATPAGAQSRDSLRRVPLNAATTIDGVLCAAGKNTTILYRSGRLESCPLAADADFFGHALPAGTFVTLTEAGQPRHAWLSRDTRLQGHLCKGTGRGGWSVAFYPSGRLSLCFLALEETIDGVPCRKGSFLGEISGGVSVEFYESGRLRACGAARDVTLGDRTYRPRQRVLLDPDGKPQAPPIRK